MQKLTKEQLPQLSAGTKHLGALIRLEFRKVAGNGADIFDAYHENGSSVWHISIDDTGIIVGALVSPG